jgi:thiol-disulfide isomerase/thioredoxin
MRKIPSFLASSALVLAFAATTAAQDPQKAPTPQSPSQPAAQPQISSANGLQTQDPPPPASLGELARLARAKKASEPKAALVLNDENMAHALYASGRGTPAISFVGSDGSGSSSSGSAGRLVLLDFWATWCGPCRHALPGLKQLVSAYGDQVEVVSISEDHDEGAWRNFVEQNQMNWEQKIDANREMAKRYGVTAFPTYILIDGNGKVVEQLVGDDPSVPLTDRIGPEIRAALAGKS